MLRQCRTVLTPVIHSGKLFELERGSGNQLYSWVLQQHHRDAIRCVSEAQCAFPFASAPVHWFDSSKSVMESLGQLWIVIHFCIVAFLIHAISYKPSVTSATYC